MCRRLPAGSSRARDWPGRDEEAAAAYVEILRGGFDPEVASQLAQTLIEAKQLDQAVEAAAR